MSGGSKAVFLSYASEDSEAAAKIAEGLKRMGIEVWFDRSELRGGDAWDRKIREHIHDCALFIPIISARTEFRDEGYFRREWALAVERTRDMAEKKPFLLPIVIDGTPERGASVPEKFHQVQWTRLPAGQTTPEFLSRVGSLLANETTPKADRRAAPTVPASQAPPAGLGSRRTWVWATLPLIAALGWLAWRHFGTSVPVSLSAIAEQSIAVLPFVDLSEKHDQAYLGDGIAEEIVDLLDKIPQLRVISRTSSFQFRDASANIPVIASRLGSRYIVTGSVRAFERHLRIGVQLVDGTNGVQLWSDNIDRSLDDTLSVQRGIAAGIARALELTLGADEFNSRQSQVSPAAYTLYLRGRVALDLFNEDGFRQAESLLRQALAIDPNFAKAASKLALTQAGLAEWSIVDPATGWETARVSARRAIELDPSLADAHCAMALVLQTYDWNWKAADEEIRRALEVQPRYSVPHFMAARQALILEHLDEALTQANAALAIDPIDPPSMMVLAMARFHQNRLAEAEAILRHLIEISPRYNSVHFSLGQVLLAQSRTDAALEAMRGEIDESSRVAGIAMAEFARGHKAESDTELRRLIDAARDSWACGIATVYAFRGERDAAFDWLEKAFARRESDLAGFVFVRDPNFKNLYDDPRWTSLLRRMHLAT